MTPERRQKYKDTIDEAIALLMDFRISLDNPTVIYNDCAFCGKRFDVIESGACPPDLIEHGKTCSKSPHVKEIERLRKLVKSAHREGFALIKGCAAYDTDGEFWAVSAARKALEQE